MARTLDFSAVWEDTVAMLRRHQEALVAVAGLLIFVPSWASAFFVPPPDVEGSTLLTDVIAVQSQNFRDHWAVIVPLDILSVFGGLAVLTLLLRADKERVGDALMFALMLLPAYLAISLLSGLIVSVGALALFVGMLYLSGRFMPVGPVFVAESEKGIIGSLARSWDLTHGLGWKCFSLFLIVFVVGFIATGVVNLVVGTFCKLAFGPEGLPFAQTFFDALTETAFSIVLLALEAALFRHLQQQDSPSLPQ